MQWHNILLGNKSVLLQSATRYLVRQNFLFQFLFQIQFLMKAYTQRRESTIDSLSVGSIDRFLVSFKPFSYISNQLNYYPPPQILGISSAQTILVKHKNYQTNSINWLILHLCMVILFSKVHSLMSYKDLGGTINPYSKSKILQVKNYS